MSTTTNESGPPLEAAVTSVKQKRTAERQLTKDDDPDDGDDSDSGDLTAPFHKADEQVLKGRRILKARRPVSNSTTATAAAAPSTTTTATPTTDSSVPTTTNPFASTTLIVEPSVVPLPAPGPATGPTTLADTKQAEVIVPATSKQDQEQPTVNQEQTKGTHSEAETTTAQDSPNIPTATTTTTASTSGPFKVFGSFAGFGGGFSTTGFGTAAAAGTIHSTAPTPATSTSTPTDSTTTANSATTGFAFASTSSSSFGIAPSTTTSTTAGSIFGSVSNNSFSFGFANPTNGGEVPTSISPKVTLPESVELTTGEEEELNLHDCRCKTFKWVPALETEESTPAETKTTLSVKPSKDFQIQITDAAKDDATATAAATPNDTDQETTDNKNGDEKQQQQQQQQQQDESPSFRWQELGVGPMKLLQDNSDPPKYRLVQRRESSPNGPATKVLLNLPLYKESKVSLKTGQENYLSFITIGHDGRNETYLWKFKEVSQAQMFARFLDGILPHARSCFVG